MFIMSYSAFTGMSYLFDLDAYRSPQEQNAFCPFHHTRCLQRCWWRFFFLLAKEGKLAFYWKTVSCEIWLHDTDKKLRLYQQNISRSNVTQHGTHWGLLKSSFAYYRIAITINQRYIVQPDCENVFSSFFFPFFCMDVNNLHENKTMLSDFKLLSSFLSDCKDVHNSI